MKRTLVLAVLAMAALSACNDDKKKPAYQQPMVQQCGQTAEGKNECVLVPQQQVQAAPVQQAVPVQQAPVVVQAAPQAPVVVHDNSGANMATGMALGMMAGSMMNNNNGGGGYRDNYYDRPRETVVNRTVVNKTVIVNQSPAAPSVPNSAAANTTQPPKASAIPTPIPAPAPVPVSPVAPVQPPKPTTQTLTIPPKATTPVITTAAPKAVSSFSAPTSKPSSSSSTNYGGFKKR